MSSDTSASEQTMFQRLDTFSDAIFAVAMTLLVFSFPFSDLPSTLAQAEAERLILSFGPQFETFFISFVVVGAFWMGHHEMFDRVTHYDRTFVWINFMFLLCIVFMPVPTALEVRYGSFWVPTALYAATVAATGLLLTLLWLYASYHYRLIDQTLGQHSIRMATIRSLITPVIFLLSVPVAYFSRDIAIYMWLSNFVIGLVVHRLV